MEHYYLYWYFFPFLTKTSLEYLDLAKFGFSNLIEFGDPVEKLLKDFFFFLNEYLI